jgi:multicomponent Na+:H+ antiporter subunit C
LINSALLFASVGMVLFIFGFYALLIYAHLLRKILAINIMSSGVFMVWIAFANRTQLLIEHNRADPLPHAMVITGIVVAVSATALALILMLRIQLATGGVDLEDHLHEHNSS